VRLAKLEMQMAKLLIFERDETKPNAMKDVTFSILIIKFL